MKTCPFCAEEIQDKAIKCKHCGEFLDGSKALQKPGNAIPWYFRSSFIVIAIAAVGPLALPLIWWRPQTSRTWKVGLTIGILATSWLLFQVAVDSLRTINAYFEVLNGL